MLLFSAISFKIKSQNSPQFSSFKQVDITNGNRTPYFFKKTIAETQNTMGSGSPNVNLANNWDKLSVEERNKIVMQMHGFKPPPTEASIQANLYNQTVYKQPELSEYEKLSIEMVNDAYLNESNIRSKPVDYNSDEFKAKEAPFHKALNNISLMLTGKKPLSLKDAYFQMENAYGNTYLNYNEYSNTIKQSADFIKKWLLQNGYDPTNNEHIHKGIQSFMKDTLTVTNFNPDGKTINKAQKHLPFRYDYSDFKARDDHRNFYVTKCLATGYGQCNSLPVAYLLLAEALGAKCYLSFAPNHSFIKFPDNKGVIHNYEPTSHYKINDKWYKDNFHLSNTSVESGIYLDTMNKKMIIANCIQDLGLGYLAKLGLADGKYSINCANQTLKYFPKSNNIFSYFLRSEILSRIIERYMYENKIKNIEQALQNTTIKDYYDQLIANETQIKNLGFQDMPEEMYLQLMEMSDERADNQKANNITGKEKRNLFFNVQ